ncbi:MAG: YkvA family protein [Candidatus Dormibacteraeota bacterium]|nr:YkvA family protein [Candidatus Dormibacteraeota bacterium]
MHPILSRAKELLVDVPRHGKLAYCLLRDERVPAAPKAVLLGALVLIVSPIDLPAWVPLMGELDMLALAVLAVSTFIEACPEDVRREHEAALKAGESVFDRDFRDTVVAAREGGGRLFNRIRGRVWRRDPYQSVSEG